tara:strand:- start:1409 stop:1621 length:213 start_codon:yes stop_codon:yes gene_type:complete
MQLGINQIGENMIKFLFLVSLVSLFTTVGLVNEIGETNWVYVAVSSFIGLSAFIHALITMINHDERLDNE